MFAAHHKPLSNRLFAWLCCQHLDVDTVEKAVVHFIRAPKNFAQYHGNILAARQP
jgi:hypothetical protein